jgi:hypothetical protein
MLSEKVYSKSPGLVILYQSVEPVHHISLRYWVQTPRYLPVSPKLRSTNRRDPGEGFLNTLICAAWIRSGTDDRVYLLLRKSMTIKAYIHAASKRAEIATLLDSGATENFISEDLAYQLRLPITRLHQPRPLFNINRTKNRKGDITRYTDLEIQTGSKHRQM